MTTPATPSEPAARRTPEAGLRRIRALVALAVAGAVVLGAVGAVLALRAYAKAKDDEVARLENSAVVAAGDYAQFVSGRVLVLDAVGTSDTIVAGDVSGIQSRLERVDTGRLLLGEGIAWFDTSGTARAVVGSDLPRGSRPRGDLARLMAAAVAGGVPQVSGSIEDSPYGEPIVAIVVPTRGADGRVNGTLVGGVSVAYMNELAVQRR